MAATLRQIAAEAGVSVDTVSRVLNGKNKEIWPSAIRRADEIRSIARRLRYIPHAGARSMRTRQTRHIGILLPGIGTATHETELVAGIYDRFRTAGCAIPLLSARDISTPEDVAGYLRTRSISGLIVLGLGRREDLQEAIEAESTPTVWLDNNRWAPERSIRRDECAAGRMATDKLIAAGFSSILYVGFPEWPTCHYSVIERYEGVAESVRKAGARLKEIRPSDLPRRPREAIPDLLNALAPDVGVVAWNVQLAQWVAHGAADRGWIPGRDYGLCCCDDAESMRIVWPGLSRVRFDRRTMGRDAARMLISLLEGKDAQLRSSCVAGQWIEGTTIGRPRPRAAAD